MSALSTQTPVRVLVDHYHDAGEQYLLTNLRGGLTEPTICRERLTWGVLKRYHVAVIDATGPAKVTANELTSVERFVAEGGGLLIAGSAPHYDLVTGESPARMPAYRFAELFGFSFLTAEHSTGQTHIDSDFRIGYRDEDTEAVADVVDGFGPHPPGMETCAPLGIPEDARALVVHARTGEPLVAVARHGAGRVCVSASPLTRFNVLAHLNPLLAWLSADSGERPGAEVPAEIGRPSVHTVQGLKLICDEPLADRAEEMAALARRFDSFMADLIGEHWESPRTLHIAQTSHRPRPWEDDDFVPAAGPDWAVAYSMATALAVQTFWHGPEGNLLTGLFPEATVPRHIALRFLDSLGYTAEAGRLRQRAAEALASVDPSRTEGDLARVYSATQQWHPKGHWLLEELERRFGEDFLSRLFDTLPGKRDSDPLPGSWAWRSDRLAYYIGLAAGEDVTGLLEDIGTTVHPLPIVPPDDDTFDEAIRGVLAADVLADGASIAPGRRMEALTDLSRLTSEERTKLPERARELIEAFQRSVVSDTRGVETLEALAEGDDPSHAAWAALQLVTMGREQWADRLAELLPEKDLRFRMMAGHALRKVGREVPGTTLQALGEQGRSAGELEIMTRDVVAIHPQVDGYEIANVLAEAGFAGFPHGNLATQFYIYWVHTSPQWRRSGLSRLAFEVAMKHPEALRCSCFALNTGTRNSAHALYRDFGYVDMDRRERALKHLHTGTPSVPPDGVIIRPIGDEDRAAVREFIRKYHADAFMISPLPVPDLGPAAFTALAEHSGELIGTAMARYEGGDSATLQEVAVAENEDGRAEIGVALVARLHGMLARAGAQRVVAHVCSDPSLLTDAICRAGYSREASGGVNMFGLRNLPQLFREIRPLFEERLRETPFEDWEGRIILLGDRLRAGLQIEKGSARVLDAPEPRDTDVVLRTSDETITRLVTGRETPLEGYLQRVTTVEPQVSPGVMKLLETLFPEVPFVIRWGW